MNNNTGIIQKASKETFWSLVNNKNYKIDIPRIQRDYAQGRETEEIKKIRESFLNDAFTAISSGGSMDINFIYGNIEDMGGNKHFIPIDGQQRLTTLFLIYWYFASYCGKISDASVKKALSNFTYDTRFEAGGFCSKLVNVVNIDLKELSGGEMLLLKKIKDYSWFYSTLEDDATIKSMLVMLQDIHDLVKEKDGTIDFDLFFEKLTDGSDPISFLFLDINDMGLTDEIYIKMNARGRALTKFENFKAQLNSYLANKDETFANKFIFSINGCWSNFFWNEEYRPTLSNSKKSIIFDDQILSLFRFVMYNNFIERFDPEPGKDRSITIRNVLRILSEESDFSFVSRLFVDEYRKVGENISDDPRVDIDTFKFINVLLNVFEKRKNNNGNLIFTNYGTNDFSYIDEEELFKRLIRSTSEKPLIREERTILYAEYSFLVKYCNQNDYSFDKENELTEWLTVIYKLAKYTTDSNEDVYYRMIKAIKRMIDSDVAINIKEYLASLTDFSYNKRSDFGFGELQSKEECIKAILLLQDPNWKNVITDAENSFLNGHIDMLLDFSGIEKLYDEEMSQYKISHSIENASVVIPRSDMFLADAKSNSTYFELFKSYLEKFKKFFDSNGLINIFHQDAIFIRTLLVYGDNGHSYISRSGRTLQAFFDGKDKNYGYDAYFFDKNDGRRIYLKYLFDDINVNEDIITQLERIVSTATFAGENAWKKYLVKMPEILGSVETLGTHKTPDGNFLFRQTRRYILLAPNEKILLLSKTASNSFNVEYYSYVAYLKAKQRNMDVSYQIATSEDGERFLYYHGRNGNKIIIKAEYNVSGYLLVAKNENNIEFSGDVDSILLNITNTIQ